jgi:hypothetical protein
VEPVFGQIKNLGFRRFHLRGFSKVAGEFALVCLAHNLRKVVKHGDRGRSAPTQLVNSNREISISEQKSIDFISCSIKCIINIVKKLSTIRLRSFLPTHFGVDYFSH